MTLTFRTQTSSQLLPRPILRCLSRWITSVDAFLQYHIHIRTSLSKFIVWCLVDYNHLRRLHDLNRTFAVVGQMINFLSKTVLFEKNVVSRSIFKLECLLPKPPNSFHVYRKLITWPTIAKGLFHFAKYEKNYSVLECCYSCFVWMVQYTMPSHQQVQLVVS